MKDLLKTMEHCVGEFHLGICKECELKDGDIILTCRSLVEEAYDTIKSLQEKLDEQNKLMDDFVKVVENELHESDEFSGAECDAFMEVLNNVINKFVGVSITNNKLGETEQCSSK